MCVCVCVCVHASPPLRQRPLLFTLLITLSFYRLFASLYVRYFVYDPMTSGVCECVCVCICDYQIAASIKTLAHFGVGKVKQLLHICSLFFLSCTGASQSPPKEAITAKYLLADEALLGRSCPPLAPSSMASGGSTSSDRT